MESVGCHSLAIWVASPRFHAHFHHLGRVTTMRAPEPTRQPRRPDKLQEVVMEGATVEEAVEAALRALNAAREDVAVTVEQQPSRALFGLVRRPARVRVVLKPVSPPAAAGDGPQPSPATGSPGNGSTTPGRSSPAAAPPEPGQARETNGARTHAPAPGDEAGAPGDRAGQSTGQAPAAEPGGAPPPP